MRLRNLRIAGFGPDRAALELGGEGDAVRALVVGDGSSAALIAEALDWALRGVGPESRRSTEVEVEWSDGKKRLRVRRWGKKAKLEAWSGAERDGEPEATDEAALASLLAAHGLAPGCGRAAAVGVTELAGRLLDEGGFERAFDLEDAAAAARGVEDSVERLLVEVESRADALRLRRAEALSAAAEHLGAEAAEELALEELEDRCREAELRLEAARAASGSLAEASERTADLLETASARQERLEQLEEARRRLREAERGETERRRLERELDRAESAAALAPREEQLCDRESLEREAEAGRVLRERERVAETAERDREAAEATLRECEREESGLPERRERLVELEDLDGVLALLQRTRESLSQSEGESEQQRQRRAEAAALLEDLRAREASAGSACERARAALGDEGAQQVAALREELDAAEARLSAARRLSEAQERRREVTKIHATTMIHLDRARRALDAEQRQLERRRSGDGPEADPAVLEEQHGTVAGLQSDVDRLAVEESEQDAAVQELGAEVLRLRQELGALAYRDVSELEREVAGLRERLVEAGAPAEALARAERELAAARAEAERTAAELAEAESALTAAQARVESERDLAKELESRVPAELREAGALERERSKLEAEIEEIEARARRAREEEAAAASAAEEAAGRLAEAARAHESAAVALEQANEELTRVVEEAGFRDLAAFREAKRDEAERAALAERVEAMRVELEEAREAHRELEGLTNVPVLRDADRTELEREEWERRHRERKERLQAERVYRDRELLEGLRDELAAAVAESAEDEARLADAKAALDRVAESTRGFSEELRAIRERHAALSRLADLAGGRTGPVEGFAGEIRRAARAEAAARAGQWCRRLTDGELHLEVPAVAGAGEPELREVQGRGRRSLAEAPPEERWLAALCLLLGAADSGLLARRSRRPGLLVIDAAPESGEAPRLWSWLERLAAELGRVVIGVAAEKAPDDALRLETSSAAASRSAG